ncbi:hypothetical protein [Roseateles sp. PN1]|uniref:hypothetical protein n=1 Tax=Roseateles sp. PN1 TaxID=3137372 RepID=UPI003139C5ED
MPVPKPAGPSFSLSAFATAAPRGVVAGAAQSGGFFSDVLGAFGQSAATTYTGDLLGGMSDKQRKETEQARQTVLTKGLDFSSEAGDSFRSVAQGYAPDPSTAHLAERLVFDFSRFASKAVGYTIAGGGVIGPALTGFDEGMQAASDLKAQGVDLATRTKAGSVIGAVSALGVGLPMAGQTGLQTAALVAAGGPVSFMGQQAAVRQILQEADYSKLSEQYDPFDPVGLAVSTLVPAAFGVHGLRVNKAAAAAKAADDFRTGPVPSAEKPTAAAAREVGRPSEEHVDAARTLLAVEERQRSNPFKPDDMRAYDVHEQALSRAIDQMASGQPVHVAEVINAPDLTAANQALAQIDALQAERAGLLPEAGGLAEPGAIRTARQELRMMEQQRPDTSEAGIKALAKEIQITESMSYKAALSEARKQTDTAVQEFEARQTRINQAIEANAKAQQATQKVGEIDRRIAALEQQLGPEAKLAQFERTLSTNMRALVEQAAPAPRATTEGSTTEGAKTDEAPPAMRAPAEAAAPRGTQANAPAGADGTTAAPARLVDDGAATRVAQIEIDQPNLMVQLDGMDKPMRLADVLAAVKAEADEMKLDGDLMQAAAECALLQGV